MKLIGIDQLRSGHLEQAKPMIDADQVQTTPGFSGAPVTLAVLDTAIDTLHPELSDERVAERCFCANRD